MDLLDTEFYGKVARVQNALKAPKNQFNKFGGYKYRSCEDILEAAKPLCIKEGLVLTITDDIVEIGTRIYVKAEVILTDGKGLISTCAFARESEDKKGMDSAQITGATSSYARKYALNGMFCIDDTKDPDTYEGENKAPSVAPRARKVAAATTTAPVVEYITDEQIKELQRLKVDPDKLCIYYKANSIRELTKQDADDAIARKKAQVASEVSNGV